MSFFLKKNLEKIIHIMKIHLGFPGGTAGSGSSILAAVARVCSLARELWNAMAKALRVLPASGKQQPQPGTCPQGGEGGHFLSSGMSLALPLTTTWATASSHPTEMRSRLRERETPAQTKQEPADNVEAQGKAQSKAF